MKTTAALIAAALSLSPVTVMAQDTDVADPGLSIELNAATPQDTGCKLSFLVQNTHSAGIASAVFETVIFDAAGQVNRLTLFDFGALPASRPRVRQFVIPGSTCDDISQILFNGAQTCDGSDLPDNACSANLTLATRTKTEVTG